MIQIDSVTRRREQLDQIFELSCRAQDLEDVREISNPYFVHVVRYVFSRLCNEFPNVPCPRSQHMASYRIG